MMTTNVLGLFRACYENLDLIQEIVKSVDPKSLSFTVNNRFFARHSIGESEAKAVIGFLYALKNIIPVAYETWKFDDYVYDQYIKGLEESGEINYFLMPNGNPDEIKNISPKLFRMLDSIQNYDYENAIDKDQLKIDKILKRKGMSHAKKFILWHDALLAEGDIYTTKDIRKGIGLTEDSRGVKCYEKTLYNTSVLQKLLDNERIDKATYKKTANWHRSDKNA